MSLINQVLNSLEERGAHTSPDHTLIRAVPVTAEYKWVRPMVVGVVLTLIVTAVVWKLLAEKKQSPAQIPVERQVTAISAVVPASSVLELTMEASPLPASKLSYELSDVPEPVVAKPRYRLALAETKQEVEPKPVARNQESNETESESAESPSLPQKDSAAATRPRNEPATSPSTPVIKQVSRSQQADAEYRKAVMLQQQGHGLEALVGFETALKMNAQHDEARLALVSALLQNNRGADAERVMQEGLKIKHAQTAFSMALARMQVARGDMAHAMETLQKNLVQADNKPEYQAFYAALLQREGRHKEAIVHYQIAVQSAPRNGIWLMGYGISLQAVERVEDAKSAYQQALATQTLSPELTAFVQQKLKGL